MCVKKEQFVGFLPFYLLVVILFIGIVQASSSAVTVISENTPIERRHCIVIDAGHGGIDGGAVSLSGKKESDINLAIALRLDDLLHFMGYETLMIRRTDVSVYTQGMTIAAKKVSDLKERVRIVNETEGAILVSLHQNSFSDTRYGGAQVFYAADEESHRFATQLQQSFNHALCIGSSRKEKSSAGIYLMQNIKAPGVLVECGFLSNPEDEAALQTAEYQQKICCVISAALCDFVSA